MLISKIKVLKSHGRQYISDLNDVELSSLFRGCPVLASDVSTSVGRECVALCPVGAIAYERELSLDVGRCVFCNECAKMFPEQVRFTNNFRMASATRDNLVVRASAEHGVAFDADAVRAEIKKYFGRALKLRSVSAGGDNSCEMELGAVMNVNFDFSRYGIDFVASPRHADGVVVTGAVTAAMAEPLRICYEAIAEPKIVIAVGTDAISGGLFAGSRAVNRSFFDENKPDLYIPGNPVHPLTFIDGVLKLVGRR